MLLRFLREKDLYESTVIIVSNDHGDMDTNHRLIFNGPFMYEHLVHVPLIVRVPQSLGGGKNVLCDALTTNVDLAPTILDFAGAERVDTDGVSLVPFLRNQGSAPRREFVIAQYYGKQNWVNPIRMIRSRRWKFNRYANDCAELYDLRSDPDELRNLSYDPSYARYP